MISRLSAYLSSLSSLLPTPSSDQPRLSQATEWKTPLSFGGLPARV